MNILPPELSLMQYLDEMMHFMLQYVNGMFLKLLIPFPWLLSLCSFQAIILDGSQIERQQGTLVSILVKMDYFLQRNVHSLFDQYSNSINPDVCIPDAFSIRAEYNIQNFI